MKSLNLHFICNQMKWILIEIIAWSGWLHVQSGCMCYSTSILTDSAFISRGPENEKEGIRYTCGYIAI